MSSTIVRYAPPLIALIALIAIALALYFYPGKPEEALQKPGNPALAAKPASGSSFGRIERASRNLPPQKKSQLPLSEQVDQLIASGKAEDAFEAYRRVAACMAVENWQAREISADGCVGLTERLKMSRLDYLAIAARAGVPGAAVDFFEEGPFGDTSALQSRADDPLVQAWKKQAVGQLTTQAAGGNFDSLMLLDIAYRRGGDVVEKNAVLALGYAYSLRKIYQDIGLYTDAYDDKHLRQMENGMTQDQIASATAAANEIAANTLRERAKQR